MDKRTFLFVISLSLALFAVNLFFQNQNQESLRDWSSQQQTKRIQKQKALETEIAQRTVTASQLPLTTVYADEEGKTFLTTGILIDQSLLTLSWNNAPPQKVFAKSGTDQKLTSFQVRFAPKEIGGPLLYQEKPVVLKIGALPEFGRFDLQMITAFPGQSQKPYDITLGEFTDGHFAVPLADLIKLENESEGKEAVSRVPQGNALVLMKTSEGFLPVGIYLHNQNKLDKGTGTLDLQTSNQNRNQHGTETSREIFRPRKCLSAIGFFQLWRSTR